jgi:hypothetical protein
VRKLRDGTNNGDRSHLKKKRILLVQKEVSTIHMLVTENLVTGKKADDQYHIVCKFWAM